MIIKAIQTHKLKESSKSLENLVDSDRSRQPRFEHGHSRTTTIPNDSSSIQIILHETENTRKSLDQILIDKGIITS